MVSNPLPDWQVFFSANLETLNYWKIFVMYIYFRETTKRIELYTIFKMMHYLSVLPK